MFPIVEKAKTEIKDESKVGVVPVTQEGPYKVRQLTNRSLKDTIERAKKASKISVKK